MNNYLQIWKNWDLQGIDVWKSKCDGDNARSMQKGVDR